MARELGLNPGKFGSLDNHKQEPWKTPLPEFIEEIYFKHFGKKHPDNIRSIEQIDKDRRKKEADKKALKKVKNNAEKDSTPDQDSVPEPSDPTPDL